MIATNHWHNYALEVVVQFNPPLMHTKISMKTMGKHMPTVHGTKSVNYGSIRNSGLRRDNPGNLWYTANIAASVAACGPDWKERETRAEEAASYHTVQDESRPINFNMIIRDFPARSRLYC